MRVSHGVIGAGLSLCLFAAPAGIPLSVADEPCPRVEAMVQNPQEWQVSGGLAYLEAIVSPPVDGGEGGQSRPIGFKVARAFGYKNPKLLLSYLKGYAVQQKGCAELHMMLRPKHAGGGMVGSFVVPIRKFDAAALLLQIPQLDDPSQHQWVRIRRLGERNVSIDVMFLPAAGAGELNDPTEVSPAELDSLFGLVIEYTRR